MPRLGESVAEGTIGAWLKNEGELVERDEALAEVITDKINAELPSPVAGSLVKILVGVDETVAVGVDIALVEEYSDIAAAPFSAGGQPEVGPDRVLVKGEPDRAVAQGLMTREAYTSVAANVNESEEGARRALRIEEEERQRISPLARRLAHEHGIDLRGIAGTGTGGRVRKEDILVYVEKQRAAPVSASASATIDIQSVPKELQHPPLPEVPVAVAALSSDEELIKPSRMRLAIAEHMVRSKHTSPHATTVVEVDMTNITKWLAHNKEEFKRSQGYGISYVPFVMKAVCEGIRKFPIINSTWTADNKIIIKKRINLGIAVATDDGLVVPTIYDADQYTVAGLARQVNALAQRARTNKLTIQDMQNSTFVVNNPGIFGTIISMPIINQPHAGIVSMDAVVKRPVVIEDDAIAVRSMMYLSLSFDHRILDGAGAGGFLQAVRTKLQSYGREIDIY
jgi:pyruvate/2-oxoglutarate dehydrogenase complex dihydrolipoamide acyltransferase (E2) component